MEYSVLVVDDEPMTLDLMKLMLETAGCKVFTATDGFKALTQVRKRKPDIVLLDIMMPQMDGYEVCKRIRSDEATYHIPIIIFSGTARPNAARDGFYAGANRYLPKPISRQVLLETIQEVMTENQPTA